MSDSLRTSENSVKSAQAVDLALWDFRQKVKVNREKVEVPQVDLGKLK